MSRPLSEMVMQACVSSFGSSLRPHFPKASGVRSRTLLSSRHQSSKSTLDEIQSKKQAFELKYAAQLTAKLQEKGLRRIDEFKAIAEKELEQDRKRQRKTYEDLLQKAGSKTRSKIDKQTASTDRINYKEKKYRSPIKPLDDILDLSKVVNESPAAIKKLWTAYHLAPATPPRLGAVIPTETYQNMINVAKKYSSFVIPIPATLSSDTPQPASELPMEMHFLQWSFIKPPPEASMPNLLNPVPTPPPNLPATTVLFTPLAEYQMRQEFAQPALILTHYTDLAQSHGLVLMRGDLTPSTDGIGRGRLGTAEAQLLVLRLQQLYHWSSSNDQSKDTLQQSRQELLRCFHEKPSEFDIRKLVEAMNEL